MRKGTCVRVLVLKSRGVWRGNFVVYCVIIFNGVLCVTVCRVKSLAQRTRGRSSAPSDGCVHESKPTVRLPLCERMRSGMTPNTDLGSDPLSAPFVCLWIPSVTRSPSLRVWTGTAHSDQDGGRFRCLARPISPYMLPGCSIMKLKGAARRHAGKRSLTEQTHTLPRFRPYTHTQAPVPTRAHTQVRDTHAHTYTHTHTHARTHTRVQDTHAHTYTHIHAHTHTQHCRQRRSWQTSPTCSLCGHP